MRGDALKRQRRCLLVADSSGTEAVLSASTRKWEAYVPGGRFACGDAVADVRRVHALADGQDLPGTLLAGGEGYSTGYTPLRW